MVATREAAASLVAFVSIILVDLSAQLVQAFSQHPLGLCGQHDPARAVTGVEDLEQRLGLLALGTVLDINPLAAERWARLVSLAGHWLLEPSKVAYKSSQQVQAAMEQTQLLGPRHISRVWWQISRGVQGRFEGSWRELIKANHDNAQEVRSYLRKGRATFPVLAGPVVSVRWLDLVHRIGAVRLQGWETLAAPLPSGLKNSAQDLGILEDEVHPLIFSAIHLWAAACQKLSDGSCGFSNCPNK